MSQTRLLIMIDIPVGLQLCVQKLQMSLRRSNIKQLDTDGWFCGSSMGQWFTCSAHDDVHRSSAMFSSIRGIAGTELKSAYYHQT